MTFDLPAALPMLTARAIAWAEAHYFSIAESGQPLNDEMLSVARSVGVSIPELIRVMEVPTLPLPVHPELRQVGLAAGLFSPDMVGMTLGYGIYIRQGQGSIRRLSHEFRLVHQFELAGSIAAFLPVYLGQIATFGYKKAPIEVDAWAHVRDALPGQMCDGEVAGRREPLMSVHASRFSDA
jgi:hypothetical protein